MVSGGAETPFGRLEAADEAEVVGEDAIGNGLFRRGSNTSIVRCGLPVVDV